MGVPSCRPVRTASCMAWILAASRRDPGRMADPGGRRRVLPAPAEGRLLPQSRLGALPPGRPAAVLGRPARPPGPEQPAPAVRLRRGTRWQRPVPVPVPGWQASPAEQLRPPRVPARLRRAMRAGRRAAAPDRHRRRHRLARRPARHLACCRTGRRGPEQSGGLRSAARARDPDHPGRRSGGLLASAGSGLTAHGLRHGHRTWMAEDGIPDILWPTDLSPRWHSSTISALNSGMNERRRRGFFPTFSMIGHPSGATPDDGCPPAPVAGSPTLPSRSANSQDMDAIAPAAPAVTPQLPNADYCLHRVELVDS
jgi:hypothetical protein